MSSVVHPGNVVNECLLAQMCASLGLKLNPDDLSAALVEASLQGQPFRIGGLVDQGADVNRLIANERFNHAVSPLACAASAGHTSVLCALLRRGADPNLSVGGGMTALYLASQFGHAQAVHVLLYANASPDLAKDDGATPLMIAAHQGHAEVVELLLAGGASRDAVSIVDGVPLRPIDVACSMGHVGVAALLSKCQ